MRNACTGSGKNSGTARLWYDDSAADSQFVTTIGTPAAYDLVRLTHGAKKALASRQGGGDPVGDLQGALVPPPSLCPGEKGEPWANGGGLWDTERPS
ncbi:MAG: hypothetical protein ABW020_17120 [Candidatus Rokuibacteriota bacterium]